MKFGAGFGFLTVNLRFRFWEDRSAEWKERKAKVSKGIKQKEDRKKPRGTEEGRKNEPEMGTSSTPLKLKNVKAKANPTNRHGAKPAQ